MQGCDTISNDTRFFSPSAAKLLASLVPQCLFFKLTPRERVYEVEAPYNFASFESRLILTTTYLGQNQVTH